jgi:hypothetical protein
MDAEEAQATTTTPADAVRTSICEALGRNALWAGPSPLSSSNKGCMWVESDLWNPGTSSPRKK